MKEIKKRNRIWKKKREGNSEGESEIKGENMGKTNNKKEKHSF